MWIKASKKPKEGKPVICMIHRSSTTHHISCTQVAYGMIENGKWKIPEDPMWKDKVAQWLDESQPSEKKYTEEERDKFAINFGTWLIGRPVTEVDLEPYKKVINGK